MFTYVDVGLGEFEEFYIEVKSACDADISRCEFHHSDEYQLSVSIFDADRYILETKPINSNNYANHYSSGGIARDYCQLYQTRISLKSHQVARLI